MARTRMITRTVEGTKVRAMFCDLESKTVKELECIINVPVSTSKQVDKYICENYETPFLKYVSTISSEKYSKVYAMTENEFLKLAKCYNSRSEISNADFVD